jgi:cell division septation protein DedD
MIKNKILILAIGIMSLGVQANSQTLRADNGPAEIPPKSFKGTQYIDSKGCVYIKAGYGTRITWVPRVNRSRKVFCNSRNKPSLNSAQLALASDAPTTRVIKPVAKPKVVPVQTAAVVPKPKSIPRKKKTKTKLFGTGLFSGGTRAKSVPVATTQRTATIASPATSHTQVRGIRFGPQRDHPADIIRQTAPAINGGNGYKVVATTTPHPTRVKSVRGSSLTSRRANRLAIRKGPQAVHPADAIRSYAAANGSSQVAVTRGVDPIHSHTVYPTVITADVTARGDAQMEMVWTNTVPRKLIKKVRAKEVAVARTYSTSTKTPTIVRSRTRTNAVTPKSATTTARYVQIGTFGNPTNVSRTIARFQAGGFPIRTRAIKNKGRSLNVVYLGPFTSTGELKNAMRTARKAGFKDAIYTR